MAGEVDLYKVYDTTYGTTDPWSYGIMEQFTGMLNTLAKQFSGGLGTR